MDLSNKEIKEKYYSAKNWVGDLICGKRIKEVFLAKGSEGWKENENKLAPEASCILVFDDGSEISFKGRNLNQYLGILFSPIVKVDSARDALDVPRLVRPHSSSPEGSLDT